MSVEPIGSKKENPDLGASESDSPQAGVLGEEAGHILNELRHLLADHIELVTLEARLSVNTLFRMAMISLITVLVLVCGWLALVVSAALGLIAFGLPPALAVLFVAAANFLLAFFGRLRVRRLSTWLGWPATQRAIKPKNPPSDDKRGEA